MAASSSRAAGLGRAHLLLAVLAALAGAQASAQPAAPLRAMTLAEALAYGQAHQPVLLAAQARMTAAQADARVPRAGWLPRIGATAQLLAGTANNTTASYARTPQVDIVRIGGSRAGAPASWSPAPSTLVAVGVQQEVFDFGRIAAAGAVADALAQMEGHRTEAERLDVLLNIEEAYFAVHAARAVLEASEGAYERARVHRDLAAATVKGGLRAPIELTRAAADLARFEVGRIRAQGGLEIAQSVFAAAVGVPEAQLDVAGQPPPPGELPDLPQAIAQAARDPSIRAALLRLAAQRAQTRAITAQLRPDLSLTASLSGRAGGALPSSGEGQLSGWAPEVPNWDVGLALNVPLFDGITLAQRRASGVRERLREAEVDIVRQRQMAAVQQGHVSARNAQVALASLTSAAAAAQANYAQAEARFQAGLGTSVELADAEMLRTEADIQLAIGRFEVARARARFGRVIAEAL